MSLGYWTDYRFKYRPQRGSDSKDSGFQSRRLNHCHVAAPREFSTILSPSSIGSTWIYWSGWCRVNEDLAAVNIRPRMTITYIRTCACVGVFVSVCTILSLVSSRRRVLRTAWSLPWIRVTNVSSMTGGCHGSEFLERPHPIKYQLTAGIFRAVNLFDWLWSERGKLDLKGPSFNN